MVPKGRPGGRPGGLKSRKSGGKGGANKKRKYGQKFENARLAEVEESDSEQNEDVPSSAEEGSDSAGVDSEDEVEQAAANRPYAALMQSLAKISASQSKRRKLQHQSETNQVAVFQEPEAEIDEERDVDQVEYPEEDPEYGDLAEGDEEEDDDDLDMSDPFEIHFADRPTEGPDDSEASRRLRAIKANEYHTNQSELNDWRLFSNIPGKDSIRSSKPFTTVSSLLDIKVKKKLAEISSEHATFDKLEQVLYPLTFGYNDMLFCGRTPKNGDKIRRMASLHAVNHIFKTRDRVIKNNYKVAKEADNPDFTAPTDQGFTRPKVLMILPTRQSAVKMVNAICSVCEPDQQENRKRFDESYVDKETNFSGDRAEDFRDLFEGNDDDMFRVGIKFTRKTIKYFSQFYNSDILLASPLGLRTAIGSKEDRKKKKFDYDFLSSIEMVIVDQADALLMQNWEHVEYIFDHLNLQPRELHGCDITRVKVWYSENEARYYRQTLIFSAFNTPELSELHRQCKNWAGKFRVQSEYPGTIQELGIKVKQTFSRFEALSIASEPDARFEYFTSAIVPTLTKRPKDVDGTLIFVPSYLDFVRVRNYFANSPAVQNLTFGLISEYTEVRDASKARSHFLSGRHKILLYTERAHHFRRYRLSGVRRIIMYSLPDNPIFYKEIVGGYLAKSEQGLKIEPGQGSLRVMFSKYDLLKLERVVGSKRVGKMIRERGDTFDFI